MMVREDGTMPDVRQGGGRMGGPYAAGPGGECVCPKCEKTYLHVAGRPCVQRRCTACNTWLIRKGVV